MFKFGVAAAALSLVDGARVKRAQRGGDIKGAKFLSGVPILNYYSHKEHSLAGSSAVEEDWLLAVQAGVSDEEIHALCQKSKCMREGHPKSGGVPYFEVRASEKDLDGFLNKYGNMVKYVERDTVAHKIPEIAATASSASWGLDRIGAPLRSGTGAGVSVYVLDTGIRATHNDFGGRVVPALDMSSGSLVECTSTSCAGDVDGHGTHCAGSAAGGSYGVAPAADLKTVKVLSDQGSGAWSWSYDALDWLATKGDRPAVASMSLGGGGRLALMKDSVDAAVAAGVTVVVAAGNENSNACNFSPAYVPSAITVGSTDSTDTRSWFSNYGSCVDIWAPGSDIVSAGVSGDYVSDTMSGTSMACPHVSGGAALLLEANSNWMSADVIQAMLDGAVENAISDLKPGDVNKMLYVGAGGPPPTPAPVPTPAPYNFVCNDGCDISDSYVNDGFCDCLTCEDESDYTCYTCSGGCPGSCGAYKSC